LNRKFVILFIIFLSSLVFAQQAKLNESAPDFKLTDSNGSEHSLSDFSGKIVVLEWINFDCPFVQKHYDSKNMQSLQEPYTSKAEEWLDIRSYKASKQSTHSLK